MQQKTMAPGTPQEHSSAAGTQKEKKNNQLALWGNERSMNLNPLILTNIQSSHYFKVNLYELKTYHEVIDEIYYKVTHLEPWEKGSRKTSGQTGMCGGVRGVGAGGIVSTAFCLLYKLFTLKLTRKQLNGLITHCDSPFIRALGFMFIRYTQAPSELWNWFDEYLDDPEELDVKAGGGQTMTIGEVLRHFLSKLEWFSTLFPRIPVPIQKDIERKLSERFPQSVLRPGAGHAPGPLPELHAPRPSHAPHPTTTPNTNPVQKEARHIPDEELCFGEAERISQLRSHNTASRSDQDWKVTQDGRKDTKHHVRTGERDRELERKGERERERDRGRRKERDRHHKKVREEDRKRDRKEDKRGRRHDRSQGREKKDKSREGHHKHRGERERDRYHHRTPPQDYAEELAWEKERQMREQEKDRSKHRHSHSRSYSPDVKARDRHR